MTAILSHILRAHRGRWLLLATMWMVLMLALPASGQAAISTGGYASTTAALNLRSGPSTSYPVLQLIPCGREPYVLSGPYNARWYRVRYAGTTGYVHGDYLVQGSAVSTHLCEGANAVAAFTARVRTGPSTGYPVRISVPQGRQVRVISGPYGGWYRVSYQGLTGYTYGGLLRQGEAVTVTKLATSRKVVALTFDAGSDRGYAAQILNTLRAYGVKSSFGVTGKWARANPDLVRRMVNEGHTVFNHTYNHRSLTGYSTGAAPLTYSQRASEIRSTEAAIKEISGRNTRPFFRPPYGDHDRSVLVDLRTLGYTLNLMWTVDSLGWKGLSRQEIVQRVLGGTEPGAIYLFHVGSQSQDAAALPAIIQNLQARGYTFTTFDAFYR